MEIAARGVQIVHVPEALLGAGGIPAVLHTLAVKGITRLLIEGGPRTWTHCLEASVVDEAVVYQSNAPGPADGLPVIANGDVAAFMHEFGLFPFYVAAIGNDTRHVFRRRIK